MQIKIYSLSKILIILGAVIIQPSYASDIDITGFATLVAGKVISGDEVLADYPRVGIYDKDLSISPDTSLGVQMQMKLMEDTDIVLQLVSHGAEDYQIQVDWAYLNYRINDEISAQLGRKRLPLYYYSDHFDIGYTYLWVRPPADNYTWQVTNYNGLSISYEPRTTDWDVLINLYTGKEDSGDNELLSKLSGNNVDEEWKNMVGIVGEFSKDQVDYRLTFMHGQLDRKINGYVVEDNINQQFMGLAVNLQYDELILLSEINRYQRPVNNIRIDTGLISIAYQVDEITPYVTHSRLKQQKNLAGGDEDHYTNSIGVRWDIASNMAVKAQYDKVKDKAQLLRIVGDGELISVSLDYIF